MVSSAARGGIASGAVMVRDGDCFGPVVHLAARAVELARRGAVVVAAEIATAVRDTFGLTPLPSVRLKGFADDVALFEIGG